MVVLVLTLLCCWLSVCVQKLDDEELEEVREAFNLFDTDGNGTPHSLSLSCFCYSSLLCCL